MRTEIETTIGEIECVSSRDELKAISLQLSNEADSVIFFTDDEDFQALKSVYSKLAALYAAIEKKAEQLK